MHTGRAFSLRETIMWSRAHVIRGFLWSTFVCVLYGLGFTALALPWLPTSAVAVAVAFYLGFKNNASYDRTWEARKIWGAIVNASRSWAYGARDLIAAPENEQAEADAVRKLLVVRHTAWLDALRHQLREVQSWEHRGERFDLIRKTNEAPEYGEKLPELLHGRLAETEVEDVLSQINPAAHLIARQSATLAEIRRKGWVDGFSHIHLQGLLDELMTQQGKSERIKKFPFPRQYATVNRIFAHLFCYLVPFGLLGELAGHGPYMFWMTIPFSTLVGWVFLTMDQIGDWSENPFEGLANDVPISAMSRAIERDVLQIIGETELPASRTFSGPLIY
ncbi:MAG: bestrophin family ion channel [Myxococcota bacterium]